MKQLGYPNGFTREIESTEKISFGSTRLNIDGKETKVTLKYEVNEFVLVESIEMEIPREKR